MARAKLKTKDKRDYFPKSIQAAGLQERWKKGHLEIVKEPEEGKQKATVSRLRVKEVYNSLKMITEEQKKCALRYALLVERADGATPDMFASISLCSVGRNSWEPTHAQFEAYETLTKIKAIVRKYFIEILDLVILKNKDCKAVAEIKGFSQYYAAGIIMSAFLQLEDAFEELENVTTRKN